MEVSMRSLFAIALTTLFAFVLSITFPACSSSTSSSSKIGVTAGGYLANTGLTNATILGASVLIDGNVIASVNNASPTRVVSLVGSIELSSGTHTLSFRIDTQTGTSTSYSTGAVQLYIGTALQNLADKSVVLSTGQAIEYSFTF